MTPLNRKLLLAYGSLGQVRWCLSES